MEDPEAEVFRAKSDRAPNMLKGFSSLTRDPCVCHVIETDTAAFTGHAAVAAVLKKAKALVSFFHQSTLGRANLARSGEKS